MQSCTVIKLWQSVNTENVNEYYNTLLIQNEADILSTVKHDITTWWKTVHMISNL